MFLKSKIIFSVFFTFLFLFSVSKVFGVLTWSETQPMGDNDKFWKLVASDSEGLNLIVAAENSRLYISSSSGATWAETQPAGDFDKDWSSVASDSDGSNLIAGVYGGRLYISSSSGATWAETQPVGDFDQDWKLVASDSEGLNLIVAAENSRLYISSSSGATWAETQPAGDFDKDWSSVASDSDGSNLIAGVYGGRLYISSSSGATWAETQPVGDFDKDWSSVASDSDGSNLIVTNSADTDIGGRLYISSNGGASWTETRPVGDFNKVWIVASDSDGTNLFVSSGMSADGDSLYVSSDGGANWTEVQPAGNSIQRWRLIASDSDGSNLIAGIYNGRIYIGVETPETPTPAPSSGGGGGLPIEAYVPPQIPLEGLQMKINSGEEITSKRIVNLSFNANANIEKVAISMTGDFTDAAPQDFQKEPEWDLCSKFSGQIKEENCLDGEYKIYAKFYTAWGLFSETISDTIFLKNNSEENNNDLIENKNSEPSKKITKKVFNYDLSYKMINWDVFYLQEFLNQEGFIVAESGYGSLGEECVHFGPKTRSALIKFQEANKITPAEGYFGPKTRKVVNEKIAEKEGL